MLGIQLYWTVHGFSRSVRIFSIRANKNPAKKAGLLSKRLFRWSVFPLKSDYLSLYLYLTGRICLGLEIRVGGPKLDLGGMRIV